MLSAIGRAAARHARVGANLPIRSASRLTTQLTPRTAVVVPNGFRIAAQFARGFAAKAGTAKKTAATKAKAKPAAAKKPAKAAAKPKATGEKKKRAGPKKKELTDDEKSKLEIRELKKKALAGKEPGKLPVTAWMVYLSQRMPEVLGRDPKPSFRDAVQEVSNDYKALPQSELEKLAAVGEKNKVTNEVNLKNWVDSHSAQEIREANLARQLLKRKYDIQVGPTIRDPRFPKPVMNGYAAYVKSRYHAPEYEGVSPTDRLIKIGQEWKKLSPEQRKPFTEIKETDLERHRKEMEAFRESAKL